MKDRDLILLLLVAGGAWYLYTRNQGLNLLGQPVNPMLLPEGGWTERNPMSTITPSGSTSTAATNVLGAIVQGVQQIVRSIAGPGNTPAQQSQSFAISGAQAVGGPASNYGVPNVGDPMPAYDPTLGEANPYWMWDFSFERPAVGTVPSLDWTLAPDANYIPPPPGVQ